METLARTLVLTLFTFCPPRPPDLENRKRAARSTASSIVCKGISLALPMASIRGVYASEARPANPWLAGVRAPPGFRGCQGKGHRGFLFWHFMTGKERIAAALGPSGCRETPVVICYEGIFIRDHLDALSRLPWWYQYSPDLQEQLAWRSEVIASIGQDWMRLPLSYSAEERRHFRIEATAGGVFLVDGRNRARRRIEKPAVSGWTSTSGLESIRPDELPESEADIDELIPLSDDSDAPSIVCCGKAELAHRLLDCHGDGLYATDSVASPFWLCYQLWGFEGMMMAAATTPELIRYACERHLRQQLERVRTAALLGAQGVWIEECLADLLSPEQFASLCLPYVRRLTDAIRAAGLSSIYYYCGNPEGKWDLLLDARADALALEEGKKGFAIDIERVAERVDGKCALLGNLDSIGVLQNGSRGELEAEVARQLRAGRRNGNRFVMCVGSPVTPQTPPERVREYCALVHELAAAR
jgi:hypothetical protein